MDEAIDLLRAKQQADGTWLLENTRPGKVHFALVEPESSAPSLRQYAQLQRITSRYRLFAPYSDKCRYSPPELGGDAGA